MAESTRTAEREVTQELERRGPPKLNLISASFSYKYSGALLPSIVLEDLDEAEKMEVKEYLTGPDTPEARLSLDIGQCPS